MSFDNLDASDTNLKAKLEEFREIYHELKKIDEDYSQNLHQERSRLQAAEEVIKLLVT